MLNPKEEKQYSMLRKLGQKLHVPIPEAFLELEVTDKDGKVIQKHRQRSHSWVRNAYNVMFCNLAGKNADDNTFGTGKLSAKLTDGSVGYGEYPFSQGERDLDGIDYGFRAGAGIHERGIQVGSGTNAESFEDYALQTKIINGTGAGQLSYIQSEAHSISYDAGSKVLKNDLVRYFNNNSGGDVSVNEVGLVGMLGRISGALSIITVMVSRDKLASTVTVPNTGQLKVTYTIQLTYPA